MEKSSNAEITPWGRKVPVLVDDAGSTHLVDATGAVELITTAPVAPPAFEKRAKAKRAPSRWWALVALVALFNLGALVARRAGTSRAVGLATLNNKALAAAAPKGKKASKAPKVQKAPKNAKKL